MAITKVKFQPGIYRESSQYAAGPSWFDCDKVRFRQGKPEQIGGWEKYSENSFIGVARHLVDWGTKAAVKYLGVGTHVKYYVETGGAYFDITPIRDTTAAGDVTFSASNGDATLTVANTSHAAALGDYVTFSGAVSLGGLITADVLNQEYVISSIIDADSYQIEAKDTNGDAVIANASDTGNGGAAVVGAYQINTGTNSYVPSTGWGVGLWGAGVFGGGNTLTSSGQLRLYSADIFEDDLIFNPRAGSIYYWDESAGTDTRAADLSTLLTASNTPTAALQVMVSTLDRHVIAFGVNPLGSSNIDPLLVRWSDQDDAGNWTPTAINTSGGQVLSSGTEIVGAVKARQEILIFTDTAVHSMRYSGAPFVFAFSVLSENVSALGPNAMIPVGDMVYFMDLKGFYVYEGAIRRIPCTVLDYVYSSIDRTQLYKVFATSNVDNSEVTWFYPAGENGAEINRYVTYNYQDQVWVIGTIERGIWIPARSKAYPIASTINTDDITSNYLYSHEFGYDADGETMGAYVESGELSIAEGDSFAFLRRVLPDFKTRGVRENIDVTLTIKGSNFPMETPVTLASEPIDFNTKQVHVRVRAREIILRLDSAGTGYGWTLGDFRFDLRTDGKR